MIDLLKRIGLSQLEAKCYLVMHEEAHLSGYEVAKRVSVSRTNVYAALRSMIDKGACRMIEGDPVLYDAVPIEQLVTHLKIEFEQTAKTLVSELKTPPQPVCPFYNLRGAKGIEQTIHRLAANAKKSIVADVWLEDLPIVESALVEAEQRGLNVVLIVLGECHPPLRNVFIHKRNDTTILKNQSRKFSLLCDSKVALLGNFGPSLTPTALETEHAAVVEMLRNAFYHDLLMQHIEEDFGEQLAEKYGEHYEKLLEYYIRQKGWDFE